MNSAINNYTKSDSTNMYSSY